jgi:hypothetical protein
MRKMHQAHRASWIISNGEIPDGMNVLHKCDNRPRIRPDHLFLGTHLDNVRDMDAKARRVNRVSAGTINPNAKLSEQDVLAIRELHAAGGIFMPEIAKRFGVKAPCIFKILSGRSWKSV